MFIIGKKKSNARLFYHNLFADIRRTLRGRRLNVAALAIIEYSIILIKRYKPSHKCRDAASQPIMR